MNQRTTLSLAAASGMLAVVLGASGAHALKPTLEALGSVSTFELANRYHFLHTLAIFGIGILMGQNPSKRLGYAVIFFALGILCFSGSLYIMSFYKIRLLGPVTPIGGVFFILGWLFLLLGAGKK